MPVSACILSVSGPHLLAQEKTFLQSAQPWGVILMGRSCQNKPQIRGLISDIHEALGREALIFIDQEGGRVARLKPPEWSKFPAAGVFGEIFQTDPERALRACEIGHQLLGAELSDIGIRADCAPCGDLRQVETHDAIGDRSFGYSVTAVSELAGAALNGLEAAGVVGCIKHLPGQGRAAVDSHYDLPRVSADAAQLSDDFAIFATLATRAPMAMTGHVIFETLDPIHPATISETIISETIRGRIGFDGLLMTDDLGMDALGGSLELRGERALGAGCDVLLHCSGFLKEPDAILAEMEAVASAAGSLTGQALRRADAAMAALQTPIMCDTAALWQEFRDLMAVQLPQTGV